MTDEPTQQAPIAVPCDAGTMLLLEPPPGWLMSPVQLPARVGLIDPNAQGPFWPNINVVVQDLGKMTVDEFVTLTRLQLKALGDAAVVQRDESIGPESAGHRFDFISYSGPVPVRCQQLILFHSGRAFVVTALASLQQFDNYRSRFEKVFDSVAIRVTAAPGTRPLQA